MRGEYQGEDTLLPSTPRVIKGSLYYTLQERTVEWVRTASVPVMRTRTYTSCVLMLVVSFLMHVIIYIFLFIHYLQLGRHPVAEVVTCYVSTDYEDRTLKFRYGGLREKHVVATWNCREPSQHLLKDPEKPGKT